MMKRIYIIGVFAVLLCQPLWAQVDKRDVRRGNRDFRKGGYSEAEIDYRKALVKDTASVAANYNLANTLFRQDNPQEAQKTLEKIKETASMSAAAADYWYNLGDAALANKDYRTAVEAFAQSLLRNPGDLQAKENYIYAKKKLQDQQNQQNDQNQDGQNDQNQNDKNQDQQDQDGQNDQNKDNQDQNDQNQDQQDRKQDEQDGGGQDQQQQNQPQQGQQPKITPQAAQQMLQAIQAKEKETQDKVKKQKAEALKSRQKEKNW